MLQKHATIGRLPGNEIQKTNLEFFQLLSVVKSVHLQSGACMFCLVGQGKRVLILH